MFLQLQGGCPEHVRIRGDFRHRLPRYLWLGHVPGCVHSEQHSRKFQQSAQSHPTEALCRAYHGKIDNRSCAVVESVVATLLLIGSKKC